MSSVLKLIEKHGKNDSTQSQLDLIKALREFHHSIHARERSDAIEALGQIKNSEASRELIQVFADCQWRSTKLQIIRVLSNHPSQRSLEFLFKIAQENKDIPLSEAAIWSLGQTHHVLAARFLVQLYQSGNEHIKPFVVAAVGHIPDRTLISHFLKELPVALASQQTLLAKNLILTLGDLKVKEALPLLSETAKEKQHRSVALSALMSLGKISREAKIFEELEAQFKDDSFEHQIFTSARNQAQFRSEWRLEDYLQKLFESDKFHSSLLFELNAFSADDVREGLILFNDAKNFKRICLALANVDFNGVSSWYTKIFDFDKMTDQDLAYLLTSMSHHMTADFEPILNKLKPRVLRSECTSLLDSWVEALALCLPYAETTFKSFFSSTDYMTLKTEQRIQILNQFTNFALTIQCDLKRIQNVTKIFEIILENEKDVNVQARIIRAVAQIGSPTHRLFAFLKEHISSEHLTGSGLYFLEMCPDKQSAAILEDFVSKINSKSQFATAAIKALTAQKETDLKSKVIEAFVLSCISEAKKSELQRWSLSFVAKYPSALFKEAVLNCLKSKDPSRQLQAAIALKSLNDETVADDLALLLSSASESLRGRALDSLTGLPGNRAKRLVIDYLRDHAEDVEVCDKVIRCFVPPEGPTEYFIKVVSSIIQKYPQHEMLEGLVELKEKLGAKIAQASALKQLPKGTDIAEIDRQLMLSIPIYSHFDESAKTALRSAEVPFHRPEMFDVFVDKSSSVLGYAKAVDIILEKQLGRKLLFPKLESSLHEFQNVIHTATLNEEYPSAERVLKQLGLEKHFSTQSLPLHKMSVVSRGILNSKIIHEHFKVLDGLRAWAVMLLLFARKTPSTQKPLISNFNDEQMTINLARKLMWLQDLRNPVAHRQTLVDFKTLEDIKSEVVKIFLSFEQLLFSKG